ncbi:hypothetical protein GCM10028806_03660 [Spirosoma terrae]
MKPYPSKSSTKQKKLTYLGQNLLIVNIFIDIYIAAETFRAALPHSSSHLLVTLVKKRFSQVSGNQKF